MSAPTLSLRSGGNHRIPAIQHNPHQILNPLVTSINLTGLQPFTTYQVMMRGVRGSQENMSSLQTNSLLFTTTAGQPVRHSMDTVSVKDLVLVFLLLLLWLLVIMLFLHRWGELTYLHPLGHDELSR